MGMCFLAPIGAMALLLGTAASTSSTSILQTTTIQNASGATVSNAGAMLLRSSTGVAVNVMTNGLRPNHVYTAWYFVFDQPQNCVNGCDFPDIFNPATEATLFGAIGATVSDSSGRATFAGYAGRGRTPTEIVGGDGVIDNPFTAEVQVVLRSHGPAIPGLLNEQLSLFNGGCPPNQCVDDQVAVFLSPQ